MCAVVALNYSVLLFETMCAPSEACRVAKKAMDDAVALLEARNSHQYEETVAVLHLLQDNLELWAAATNESA